jgi:hypothetical protein
MVADLKNMLHALYPPLQVDPYFQKFNAFSIIFMYNGGNNEQIQTKIELLSCEAFLLPTFRKNISHPSSGQNVG